MFGFIRVGSDMDAFADLVMKEEARRQACWRSADRWRAIQEAIEWADRQQAVPRNSRASCLMRQQRMLGADGRLLCQGPTG